MTTAELSREQIRRRIDLLEGLGDVKGALEDVAGVEFDLGERELLDVGITARSDQKGVANVLGLPTSVVLAGLKAMERELVSMAGLVEVK
jgi:hypothetical protein